MPLRHMFPARQLFPRSSKAWPLRFEREYRRDGGQVKRDEVIRGGAAAAPPLRRVSARIWHGSGSVIGPTHDLTIATCPTAMPRGPRKIVRRPSDAPSLSLCMIVKNEAETLERCLASARPHVDEIVIVDTGSTDGTQEIARRYADVFDEIEWPNSFSIARNHSFDLATGTYLLVLDGDEYIEDEEGWQEVRRGLQIPNLAAVRLPVRNLLSDEHIVAADRIWQERVLLNHPRIRYSGKVHNQIQDAVLAFSRETGYQILRGDAEVVHTGYAHDPERMQQKYAPRLTLLLDEYLEPRSEVLRSYYGYQLGVAYFVLHRNEDALQVLEEIDYALLNPQNAFYAHLLAAQSALRLNKAPAALVHCNEMLTITRSEPVAYFTTGFALLEAHHIADGLMMLLEAYDVNDQGRLTVRFLLNPRRLLFCLARVCEKIGLEREYRLFEAMHEEDRYDAEVVCEEINGLRMRIALAEQRAA